MISVHWYHTPSHEKEIDGTYWMHWTVDMCRLESEFRELKRLRKRLGNPASVVFFFLFCVLFLHIPILILNVIGNEESV